MARKSKDTSVDPLKPDDEPSVVVDDGDQAALVFPDPNVGVVDAPVEIVIPPPAPPEVVVPPPVEAAPLPDFQRGWLAALASVTAMVDDMAHRCADGSGCTLHDVRSLRAEIDALAVV